MTNFNSNLTLAMFDNISYVEDENQNIYFTSEEIGKHLGYADPRDAILKIYDRNKNELEDFSVTPKLGATDGKFYTTRVFTEEGVYIITALARTDKAIKFRRKVAKLLKAIRQGAIHQSNLDYYRQGVLDTVYRHLPHKRLYRAEQSVRLATEGMSFKSSSDLLNCHSSTSSKDNKVFGYLFGEENLEPQNVAGFPNIPQNLSDDTQSLEYKDEE